MGKNKLKKFSELENMDCVLQYPRERLLSEGFPFKGKWNSKLFDKAAPIVLELGCGRGEYTTGLARNFPMKNHIGVDIKGARIWSGAKEIENENIPNAKFLRTEIENISSFFDCDEIDEIWLTFPDPQMQKTRKRLTSTRFLNLYSSFLKKTGIIHLKTDSPFLYEYTRRLAKLNGFEIINDFEDLYHQKTDDPILSIKTYYEHQWLSRGKSIKLISFRLNDAESLQEPPCDDIPRDDYRAWPRHNITTDQN